VHGARMMAQLSAIMLLASGPSAWAQDKEQPRTDAPALVMDKIILVGDSVMAPMSGWGSVFCAEHVTSPVACLNLGRGARSTRSYRAEGSWDEAVAEASVKGYRGVYVLIGFGHNDAHSPAASPDRWTELDREFPGNLRRFVEELKAVGAHPILTTPIARRTFEGARLTNKIAPYSDKVKAVAAETGVPLIDLNAISFRMYEAMGPEAATRYAQAPRNAPLAPNTPAAPDAPAYRFNPKFDNIHLGNEGARAFASVMARELARVAPDLRTRLAP
jgi:lysophospholipase L1-like esterase